MRLIVLLFCHLHIGEMYIWQQVLFLGVLETCPLKMFSFLAHMCIFSRMKIRLATETFSVVNAIDTRPPPCNVMEAQDWVSALSSLSIQQDLSCLLATSSCLTSEEKLIFQTGRSIGLLDATRQRRYQKQFSAHASSTDRCHLLWHCRY